MPVHLRNHALRSVCAGDGVSAVVGIPLDFEHCSLAIAMDASRESPVCTRELMIVYVGCPYQGESGISGSTGRVLSVMVSAVVEG